MIITERYLRCDRAGCNKVSIATFDGETIREVRAAAKADGWGQVMSHKRGGQPHKIDLCPDDLRAALRVVRL